MSFFLSLFSFRGRINRKTFLIRFILLFAFAFAFKAVYPQAFSDHTDDALVESIQVICIFAYIWCFWANSAKRWHDTNRSAIYAALMVIPIVGPLLNLLLNLAIDGTPGPNRFGDPPG
jgi:uncharacterized membrane protein YhaH (DUF805 family)